MRGTGDGGTVLEAVSAGATILTTLAAVVFPSPDRTAYEGFNVGVVADVAIDVALVASKV